MELFISICDKHKVPSKTSNEWLENSKRQYSAANRHFHNVALIEKKLKLAEEIAGDEFNDALVFAILFQYFNYDVKRDLKKENCDEFRRFIDLAGIKDDPLVTDVLTMLQDESTQASECASKQIDLFNDLDLAVLGSSPDDYASYVKSLQQEYATETFKKDRLKMLKTLLMIPNIYTNPKMRERFEDVARQNIQSEIDGLQA